MNKILNNNLVRKIASIMQILLILLPTSYTFATTINTEDEINIENEINIEKDELGFYTLQYYDEKENEWRYIEYAKTYYIDESGNKQIAYGIKQDQDKEESIEENNKQSNQENLQKLTDERIWRILKNGYPNATIEELGVETEDDAYLATSQAIYLVLEEKELEEIYQYFRVGETEINEQTLEDIQRRGKKVLDAIYNLVDIGYNAKDQTMEQPTIIEKGEFEQDTKKEYYSKTYQITKTNLISVFDILNIEGAPKGTYISDINGNQKTSFNSGDIFKIMIPKTSIIKDYNITINYYKSTDSYPAYYVKSKTENIKNYIISSNSKEVEQSSLNLDINGHMSNLKIIKTDKETGMPIEGEQFNLLNEQEEIVAVLVTDFEGKAIASDINTGNYILRETKSKEEYKIAVDKNITINWNETIELKIESEKKKGQIKIIEQDKENNQIKLQGVKLEILNDKEEKVETLITDKNGEAISKELPIGKYYVKEIETNDKYILKDEKIEIQIKENEANNIVVETEKIKGQIIIQNTSEDENNILKTEEGSPIEGAKFNIYNTNNKLIEQITTDKNGIATSSKLEKGKYIVQEIENGKWYILNDKLYNVEITKNNEITDLYITNKSQSPKVEIENTSKNTVKSNEEIDYEFEIKNTGNTTLTDFTWYQILPSDYSKITKISTGTFNQEINYSIYYKTNKKDEYMIVKRNINSKENTYIDLSNIYLEEDEKITEIKIYFGKVDEDFSNIEKLHIYMKANDNLENNTQIKNYTILEGYDQEYKVTDEYTAQSIVYNTVEQKKLPKTGF